MGTFSNSFYENYFATHYPATKTWSLPDPELEVRKITILTNS
jgi:hypothetical protein